MLDAGKHSAARFSSLLCGSGEHLPRTKLMRRNCLDSKSTFTYEKELLARYGLTMVTTDMRGQNFIKILEGNVELTQWLPASFFTGWVQGFAYAMKKQQTSKD